MRGPFSHLRLLLNRVKSPVPVGCKDLILDDNGNLATLNAAGTVASLPEASEVVRSISSTQFGVLPTRQRTGFAGNPRGNYSVDLSTYRTNASHVASATYSFIGGGQSNTVSGNYSFVGCGRNHSVSGESAFAGGGYLHSVSGNFSFVGGGVSNSITNIHGVICGGSSNQISGSYSFIGGGQGNTMSGANNSASSVLGGKYNVVLCSLGAILAGQGNNVAIDADYAVTIGGYETHNENIGQVVLSGRKSEKSSHVHFHGSTTDATPINAKLIDNNTETFIVPRDTSVSVKLTAVLMDAEGATKMMTCKGLVKNLGGAVSIIGQDTVDDYEEAALNTAAVVIGTDGSNGFAILITGIAALAVKWSIGVDVVQVGIGGSGSGSGS